jgi:hypothetical protein
MARLNTALIIINYISILSPKNIITCTQNQIIGRGHLASDRQRNNRQTSTAVSDVERSHAGLHACIHASGSRGTSPHVHTYAHMSMLCTCCTNVPKSASSVTTARAESERADRRTEKHGGLHRSRYRRVHSTTASGRAVCLSKSRLRFLAISLPCKAMSDNYRATVAR